jgi:hypothetical protein
LSVKETVIAGLAAIGSDGKGAGGLKGYVTFLGTRYPKQGARLLERLLPPSVVAVNNPSGSQQIGTVNIVSVPSGKFLSSEEMELTHEQPNCPYFDSWRAFHPSCNR